MRVFSFLILCLSLVELPARAESPEGASAPAVEGTASSANVASEGKKTTGSPRLKERLTKDDKTLARIGILTPLDYTAQSYTDIAQTALTSNLERYGEFPIVPVDDMLNSLTIDDFRKVVLKNKVDVAIVMIMKPTNFDIFLFDKRTPYSIYAHSEVLPESIQYQISKEVVAEYTKVILRRLLFAFMQGQAYELPRQETSPILATEIPRWVASAQSYRTVNKEILSSFYGSANVGAALSMGNSKMWNSNLVGLQVGFRAMQNWFVELNADFFSYTALGLSVKYLSTNIDSPFKFNFGLGAAMLSNAKTLNWDQNYTQGLGGTYIVPSASVLFPIVDVHFKVEGKAYVGSGIVFTLMPGLFFMF